MRATVSPAVTAAATDAQRLMRCCRGTNLKKKKKKSCKLTSFHKADRLFQKQFAVRRCRFGPGELNEITAVQKIF